MPLCMDKERAVIDKQRTHNENKQRKSYRYEPPIGSIRKTYQITRSLSRQRRECFILRNKVLNGIWKRFCLTESDECIKS